MEPRTGGPDSRCLFPRGLEAMTQRSGASWAELRGQPLPGVQTVPSSLHAHMAEGLNSLESHPIMGAPPHDLI